MKSRLALGVACACLFAFALALPAGPPSSTFTLAMLPDTQHYSDSAANFPLFQQQTAWLVQNRDLRDIVFITHVGDIVDNGGSTTQWARADTAMDTIDLFPPAPLDGNVPYSAALGNHDFDVPHDKSASTLYTHYFGAARYDDKTWFVGASPDERNSAQTFWADGEPFLHIALEWRPSDIALEWAQGVMRTFPRVPTIVTTHEFLEPGNPGTRSNDGNTLNGTGDNAATTVFRKLVEPFPQVFLVLSGHFCGNGQLTSSTVLGRSVPQVVADYQCDPSGGNGWMQLLEFRRATSELQFTTFSASYLPGLTPGPDRSIDPESNFTLSLDLDAVRADLDARTTLHFRQGQDHGFGVFGVDYGGVVDTRIGTGHGNGNTLPGTSYGNDDDLRADGNDDECRTLLRFDSFVGSLPGQVPPGTPLEKAILTLTCEGPVEAHSDTGVRLYRMLVPWSDTDTWNSLGNGVQLGAECESVYDAATGSLFSGRSTQSFDVTSSVQAWVNGVTNLGWLLEPAGNDMVQFRSSDWAGIVERPMLTVRYLDPCPPTTRYCRKTANSFSSAGASIASTGSTSLAQNNFTLRASSIPPLKSAIFFYGSQRALIPFHDGYRCVATPLHRLGPVVFSDAFGECSLQLDFTQPPLSFGPGHVSAGSTWCFQAWYRDTQSPAGGNSNTTDAIEVKFCD